jgi:hypothetical protein
MNKDSQNELQCSQFEALLAEALDSADAAIEAGAGAFPVQTRQAFDAHRQSCPVCGPLFAEAREGMLLLRSIPEVDPPKNLVHNILAATSLAETRAQAAPVSGKTGWLEHLQQSLRPTFGGLLRSRFATSFCMAFFSLSLTLSLAGVRIDDVVKAASHPNTLRKSVVLQYTQIQASVMRYYDNMRLVYEVESRVRELKKAATPAPNNNNNNKQEQQQNRNHPNPGTNDQRNQPESSLERDGSLIAKSTMKHEGAQI